MWDVQVQNILVLLADCFKKSSYTPHAIQVLWLFPAGSTVMFITFSDLFYLLTYIFLARSLITRDFLEFLKHNNSGQGLLSTTF
jgi:hypothetical protein